MPLKPRHYCCLQLLLLLSSLLLIFQQSKTWRTIRRVFGRCPLCVYKLGIIRTFTSTQNSSAAYDHEQRQQMRMQQQQHRRPSLRQDEATSLTVMTRQRCRVSDYSTRTVPYSRRASSMAADQRTPTSTDWRSSKFLSLPAQPLYTLFTSSQQATLTLAAMRNAVDSIQRQSAEKGQHNSSTNILVGSRLQTTPAPQIRRISRSLQIYSFIYLFSYLLI